MNTKQENEILHENLRVQGRADFCSGKTTAGYGRLTGFRRTKKAQKSYLDGYDAAKAEALKP